MMTCREILNKLKSLANPENVAGMARFGITTTNAYGISAPVLKRLAREIGKSHKLAGQLWATGNREARALAYLIDEPARVTERQMERWAKDFDSWDVCDGTCLYLFQYTPFAYRKCVEWSARREEYVKRAAFSLMACLTVHDKRAPDAAFLRFMPLIHEAARDERNFVKKAVNWALRQIGKRNRRLNRAAIRTAREIRKLDSRSARWIAVDALRELESRRVLQRLRREARAAEK